MEESENLASFKKENDNSMILDQVSHDGINNHNSDLQQHTEQVLTQPPVDLEASTYNHQCYICDKIFSANSNLNRHLRKIHQENVQSPYNNVKCALCDSVYSSSSIYNQHLEKDHQVKIEVERLTFASKDLFDEWKHGVENETTSQYIKSRGEKKTKNVNKTYYSCNRSGYYVSKARTRKALKKQGSRKINGRCPASMNVTINTDSTYDVRFVKTHVGHNFELKHLDLSDKDRDLIVQKLESGITKKEIIKQIRSAVDQQQLNSTTSITTTTTTTTSDSPNNSALTVSGISLAQNQTLDNQQNSLDVSLSHANDVVISTSTTTNFHPSVNHSSLTQTQPVVSQPNSSATSQSATSFNATLIPSNCIINNQPLTSRLHLATTKDIHNIINSKHLDSKLIRHNYDLNNVEAWINEMKDSDEVSSVLFYKSQSQIVERFSKLREDDFILIIMNDGQSQVLKSYGDKCIIIDSTHHVHCEYLQLASISVIDEDGKGFPVGFLFSTRTDAEILEVFFTIIRDKVGPIATRMVIADELNDFYHAWTKVMNRPTHNLLTPWSVFDNWAKKFDLISNREKLRKLKKNLRALLTESETDKFTRSLTQIIEDNKQDLEVSEFLRYFEEKFAKNPDLWSSCLRKTHGASNFQLWRLHEKFKMVYKEGKNSKKLCKYVASLMNLFEESQMEKLIKLEEKNPTKMQALIERHKKSIETGGSLVYEVAVEPVYWLCPSESSSEVCYEVKHEAKPTPNCCDLKCPNCNICRHEFKCTCLDYLVNLNMCKHIHRICSM